MASDNEHDLHRSKHVSCIDHGELFSCVHLNREWQFHAKSHELIDVFLVCRPDGARGPPLLRAELGLYRCVVAAELYPSC